MIGLIGGIGSGKSFVAQMFAELGGHVIQADQFGHEALRQPAIVGQVVARWGETILNEKGEVDRRRLGGIVFADVSERKVLEALVFPWIECCIHEEIAKVEADPRLRFCVLDAAILLETGWGRWCDVIVYVEAPRDLRLARLANSRAWSEKEVTAREQAQLPLEEKAARANVIIHNHGDAAATRSQVEQVVANLPSLSSPTPPCL
jgi:dephospho-CoA kinase